MHQIAKVVLPISILLGMVSSIAHAEPLADAEVLMGKGDVAGALHLLEDASASGNVSAKGKLAEYLRSLPAPYSNVPRACTLAHEAADAGDPFGLVTRAECLITGAEKVDNPFPLARQLARQAQTKGWAAGGFALYEAFVLDPKYSYSSGGKVDKRKYNALVATPVAQRVEQTEALNGLASAAAAGYQRASETMLGYLMTTDAPGNLDRASNLASQMQRTNAPVPQTLANDAQLDLQQIKQLGASQVSASTFNNVYPSAQMAASKVIHVTSRDGGCWVKDIKITHVDVNEPLTNAVYLPLNKGLENSYLIQGSWSETWTFSGCAKTVEMKMMFTADGWGGSHVKSKRIRWY